VQHAPGGSKQADLSQAGISNYRRLAKEQKVHLSASNPNVTDRPATGKRQSGSVAILHQVATIVPPTRDRCLQFPLRPPMSAPGAIRAPHAA